jgi:tetratricopeptide (TPR) repeat protein
MNRIAESVAASELALGVAEACGDTDCIARVHLELMTAYTLTGRTEQAQAEYHAFRQLPPPAKRGLYRPGQAEEELCRLRLLSGTLSVELLDEAESAAQAGNYRRSLRGLRTFRGELALLRGDIPLAIAAFEHAIELTRQVGLPVGNFEARLALAKAKAGAREQAREICERLRDSARPPLVELAEVYLQLGDKERGRHHAAEGYRWAWADGPPYARHWELERCREVLGALGEPEPRLPPFDPQAVEPPPYEEEIRALTANMRKSWRKRKKDSPS